MANYEDDNLRYDETADSASTDENSPAREISADLIRGHINTIILRTLTDGEKYGTEIIEEIERKSHGQYTMKQPTLYSALKRLESQGFVTSYWGGVSNGGRRRYFNLTTLGREEAEKNIDEWEYSRSVIDCLISSRYIDFASPKKGAEEDDYGDIEELSAADIISGGDDFNEDAPSPAIAEESKKEADDIEENDGLYSPHVPYFSHTDERLYSAPTNYAEVEIPVSLVSEKAEAEQKRPAAEEEATSLVPEEPVYDYDSSVDEEYADFIREEDEADENAAPVEEEEVPLPEDTERIYINVSDDVPSYGDYEADREEETNIIEDAGASFKSEPARDIHVEEENEEDIEELSAEDIISDNGENEAEEEEEEFSESASAEEVAKESEEESVEAEKALAPDKAEEERAEEKEEAPKEAEAERRSAAATLSDSEYRKIIRQSQIDRDYKKTLERIYSSALTEENSVSDDFRRREAYAEEEIYDPQEDEEEAPPANEAEENTAEETGEFKKILEENPAIRQESEDAYKIAGYQSQELFDEHYATAERVKINQGDEDIPPAPEEEENSEEDFEEEEAPVIDEEEAPEERRPIFTRLPDDTSMPEQENVSYTPGLIDVSDIIAQANADGIKISVTCGSRASAAAISNAVVEKESARYISAAPSARLKSAAIVFVIAIIESIIVFVNRTYMKVPIVYPIIMLALPLLYLIICAFASLHRDYGKEKYVNAARGITVATIAFMVCILAICAVSIAAKITLADAGEIMAYIVMPAVYSLNLIIYAIAYYGFSKKKK